MGRGISATIMAIALPSMLLPYLRTLPLFQREWKGWDLYAALPLVPEMLRLGIAGAAMHGFEFWGVALSSIIAGTRDARL
jgi:hypothetical protein